jgi:hypothetical protein
MKAPAMMMVALFLALLALHVGSAQRAKDDEDGDSSAIFAGTPEVLLDTTKPLLWIHLPFEVNSRAWPSFGSRNTMQLNQPYLEITVGSILQHCGESFNVVLIDDETFGRLIPDWSAQMGMIPGPILWSMRRLGMAKLLSLYGGMSVPASFFCLRDLMPMYEEATAAGTRMFACSTICRSVETDHSPLFCADMAFMGAPKGNAVMAELGAFVGRTLSSDFTGQVKFLGDYSRWLHRRGVHVVSPSKTGVRAKDGSAIYPEMLLGTTFIAFPEDMVGIWLPEEELLKRQTLAWFATATVPEIMASNTVLGKFMALSNNDPIAKPRPLPSGWREWVRFWEVPLYQGQSNMYGLRPNLLPANLPSSDYPGRPID